MIPLTNNKSWPSRALSVQELNDLLSKTIKEVRFRPEIDGLIIMGSYALQIQDRNSDVDLVIITSSEFLKITVSGWKEYLSSLPTVLVMDEIESLRWVATLESTTVGIIKIDYDFILTEDISDEVQKAIITQTGLCHGKILFDRSGHLAQAYTYSNFLPDFPKYPVTTMDQFIITTWSLISMLDRGEIFEAYDIMGALRDPHILSLVLQLHNVPFENYRRLEEKIDVSWQQKIAQTICDPVTDKIAESCIDLIELYMLLWEKLNKQTTDDQKSMLNLMVDILKRFHTVRGKH